MYLTGPLSDWGALHIAFKNALGPGELFIYAVAFLAPIFYIALHDPPGADRFPSKLEHAVLTAIVTVFAAVSYGLQKSGHQLNVAVLGRLSLWFFWIAVVLVYLATLTIRRYPAPSVLSKSSEPESRGHRNRRKLRWENRRVHPGTLVSFRQKVTGQHGYASFSLPVEKAQQLAYSILAASAGLMEPIEFAVEEPKSNGAAA